MSDLIAITFPSEQRAETVRQKILEMQKDYLIEVGDAVVAVRQPNGHVKLNQMFHPTAAGAAMGSFWGLLVGLLFMVPLVGAAIGAAAGAVGGAMTDFGINDKFMKDLASAQAPNSATLFLLVRKMTADKVLADLQGVGGTVLRTSLDHSKEAALREALAGHVGTATA